MTLPSRGFIFAIMPQTTIKNTVSNLFTCVKDLKNYSRVSFKADMIAGLTVAIVAIPQSMAYAIIAGVDPKYGLYATICPVIVSALFGSSRFLIAGPTNAISMVVASTMSSAMIAGTIAKDLGDTEKIALLFLLSFLVGALQVAMGLLKFGSLTNFISHSVVIGFTAGAGILIAFNQIKNLLGLSFPSHPHFVENIHHTFLHIPETNMTALAFGLFTIFFIIISKKISPKIPAALLAMTISGGIVALSGLTSADLKLIGDIPRSLPPLSGFSPSLVNISGLFMSALAIAILGIVEALSIAKSIASKSGEKIDGNQEFIAQGLANITAAFTSGIPGSGSFTRSAVNFSSGAKTRFAAIFSGIFIMIVLLIAAPYARFIPMASLAGILMIIAYSMVDQSAFAMSFKATSSDRLVLIITMCATLLLELEHAVYIGVVLSIMLFVRKVSHPQVFEVIPGDHERKLVPVSDPSRTCPQMAICQIEGSLFFGAVAELEEQLSEYIHTGKKFIIIRMANVHLIDATGIHAIHSLLKECKEHGITLIFANARPRVLKVFDRTETTAMIGTENFFEHTRDALASAIKRIECTGACKNCTIRCFEDCPKK